MISSTSNNKIVILKRYFYEFDICISKIAILRADNSTQYQYLRLIGPIKFLMKGAFKRYMACLYLLIPGFCS